MIDIKKLSKLAEINITQEQTEMLQAYIPQAITLCDKLTFVNTTNYNATDYEKTIPFSQLREDVPSDYDRMQGLEIIVPRMVDKGD